MKKIKTLKKNYEFKKVLNKGNFYIGKQITIYINKNKLFENAIGIAIGSKTGKAVERNHIKRLIRENYYKYKNQDLLKNGYNIVFLWNKNTNVKDASYHIIKKDMEKILKKSNLLKKDEV